MVQFPNEKEREKKKNEYLSQASDIMKNLDKDALNRVAQRAYLGEFEDDNKLKVAVDREQMGKAVEAMELMVKAGKYNK